MMTFLEGLFPGLEEEAHALSSLPSRSQDVDTPGRMEMPGAPVGDRQPAQAEATATLTVKLAPPGSRWGSRSMAIKPSEVYWVWTRAEGLPGMPPGEPELMLVLPVPVTGYRMRDTARPTANRPQVSPPAKKRWWRW
jgi:hypothetical protein